MIQIWLRGRCLCMLPRSVNRRCSIRIHIRFFFLLLLTEVKPIMSTDPILYTPLPEIQPLSTTLRMSQISMLTHPHKTPLPNPTPRPNSAKIPLISLKRTLVNHAGFLPLPRLTSHPSILTNHISYTLFSHTPCFMYTVCRTTHKPPSAPLYEPQHPLSKEEDPFSTPLQSIHLAPRTVCTCKYASGNAR